MTATLPDLLAGLAEEEAARVLALGRHSTLPAGAVLFNLGDAADSLFVVERGQIALTLPMKVRGKEQDVLIEERATGQTLGWSALVPPHHFTLKAAALVDSEVVALPRIALCAHLAAHPAVGYLVAQNVSAVVGQRLQVFQPMWLREMQRVVELSQA
ncbi:MAG TPA: cyclic nucleotide-binding domain-containing protein [Vicinamibacteria bacterium]|nr:cyclic nucleotide-binding domain-containing protein [Vicinamibacteria bacterium]